MFLTDKQLTYVVHSQGALKLLNPIIATLFKPQSLFIVPPKILLQFPEEVLQVPTTKELHPVAVLLALILIVELVPEQHKTPATPTPLNPTN